LKKSACDAFLFVPAPVSNYRASLKKIAFPQNHDSRQQQNRENKKNGVCQLYFLIWIHYCEIILMTQKVMNATTSTAKRVATTI
jgi:hypothetical protein